MVGYKGKPKGIDVKKTQRWKKGNRKKEATS
jgi:hypothetical protein